MRKLWIGSAWIFLAASIAAAQTKVSWTEQCHKPDVEQNLQVGDRPNHILRISQGKCTWATPAEMEGLKTKEALDTATSEINGNTGRDRGYHIGTMDNGDKWYVSYQGKSTMKAGALVSADGTFTFTGGTGKLKGIQGKGTFSCKPEGEGDTCNIEAEYQLPKK